MEDGAISLLLKSEVLEPDCTMWNLTQKEYLSDLAIKFYMWNRCYWQIQKMSVPSAFGVWLVLGKQILQNKYSTDDVLNMTIVALRLMLEKNGREMEGCI
ncbi:hypothetical protein TSUD_357820 [Trifolium subterraneum]|uniref:Uncharacterized protein n=1 Tax=Trifolium subterraneum TaxID=3900 RepID=A0A2Z6M8T5_TRISU|nr:hypothetical protein TSUD_357820 [Trifolium subterraneum]